MTHTSTSTRTRRADFSLRRLLWVVLLLLGSLPLAAQEVALQIILPSASRMPRSIDAWESDPTIVQIIMTNVTGNDLTDLRLSFNVRGASRGMVVESADGNPAQPRFDLAPNETVMFLWEDVISTDALTYGEGVEEEFVRDGIPEDDYLICASVLNVEDDRISIGRETCAAFRVFEPSPPELVFPIGDQVVDFEALRFLWTPVPEPSVEYRLVVRPWFAGQDVVSAMESNPLWLEEVVNIPGYQVLPSDPPLDLFSETIGFVWQVQAQVNDRPFGRNEGLSRVESFRVRGESSEEEDTGPVLMPIEWRVPSVDPILVFRIEGAERDSLSGRYRVDGSSRVEVAGGTSGASFDEVILTGDLTRMIEGAVTLDRGFGATAAIDPATGRLTAFRAARRDAGLEAPNGIHLDLGRNPALSRQGLAPGADAAATIRVGDFGPAGVTATFSDNFLLGMQPFAILQGRIDFEEDGRPVAYVDRTGFRRLGTGVAIASVELPERLPLPDEQVAYLTLIEAGQELVEKTVGSDGTLLLSTRPGQPVRITVTAVPGAPQLDVELTDFVVDGFSREVLGGSLVARVPEGDPRFSPAALALPLQATSVVFRAATGLGFEGHLSLFGQTIIGSDPLVVSISEDGYAFGLVRQTGLSGSIPLVAGSERALLALESVAGTFSIERPGLVNRARHDLDLSGRFVLADGTGRTVSAAVELGYTDVAGHASLALNLFAPLPAPDPVSIALQSGVLEIDRIANLSLSFASAFSFEAELTGALALPLGESTLRVPLDKMQLRETGLVVRAHQANELPEAAGTPYGPVELTPIAFRTRPATLDWFSAGGGQAADLDPRIDLEIGFPGFRGTADALANATPTVNGATYRNGGLFGDILPYSVEGGQARAMLGVSLEFLVSSIAGRLGGAAGPSQLDIRFTGVLNSYGPWTIPDPTCEPSPITLALSGEDGFAGNAPMTPCTQFMLAMARLKFGAGTVSVERAGAGHRALLDGPVTATVGDPASPEATASGTLTLDLVTGRIASGSLILPGPFTWSYPQGDPAFAFRAPSALLNASGVTVNGAGGLTLPPSGEAAVRFGNVVLTPDQATLMYEISAGQITIDDAFALRIGLTPLRWGVGEPETPVTSESTARIDFAGGLSINSQGVMDVPRNRSGSAAGLVYGQRDDQALTAQFSSFKLGTRGSVRVVDGELALQSGRTRVAWFDANGFHTDDTPVLADRIGLPHVETAYLRVRDESGTLLVTQTGHQISSPAGGSVALVFPTLGDSTSRPTIPVTFSNLEVNASGAIIGGQIGVDADADLSPFGFPVHVQRVTYAKVENTYTLTLGARLALPGNLAPTVSVPLAGLSVDAAGFVLPDPPGEYSEVYDAERDPVGEGAFDDDRFRFAVTGVKLEDGKTIRISGRVNSAVFRQGTALADLFYVASFEDKGWAFRFDAEHFAGGAIPANRATFLPIALAADSCVTIHAVFNSADPSTGFSVAMSGVLEMPQVLGRSSQGITLQELQLGTTGISGGQTQTTNVVDLFGDILSVTAPRVMPTFSDGALRVTIENGTFAFLGRQGLPLARMTIGTDGSLAVDSDNLLGSTSLLALSAPGPNNTTQPILQIDSLRVESRSGGATLHAAAALTLPEPIGGDRPRRLAIRADQDGRITTEGLSEAYRFATSYALGDNATAEFPLGADADNPDAVFELRALSLDTNLKPEGTSLLGAGVVYLQGDARKRIYFGDQTGNPMALAADPGFLADGSGFRWNVSRGPDGTPEIDAFRGWDALGANLTAATMSPPDAGRFQVILGGELALGDGLAGGATAEQAFSLDPAGLHFTPDLTSGGLHLTLAGLVDASFGAVATFDGAPTGETARLLINRPSGDDPIQPVAVPSTQEEADGHRTTETVSVRRYVRLGPSGTTFEAGTLEADLTTDEVADRRRATGGIKGAPSFDLGARELVVYETTNGATGWVLRGVEVGLDAAPLPGLRALADLEGTRSAAGGRTIRMAGRVTAGNARGALVGKVTEQAGVPRAGVFVGLSAPVNVVPQVVALTGAGMGFFWKPESADLTRIVDLVKEGSEFQPQSSLDVADLGNQALVLYGKAGLMGSSETAAIEVESLMRRSGSLLQLDGLLVGGALAELDGVEVDGHVNLAVDARAATRKTASGTARLGIELPGLVELPAGDLDLFAAPSNGTLEAWAIHGPMPRGSRFLDLAVSGRMMLGGDRQNPFKGLLFSASAPTPYDSTGVHFAGHATVDAWYAARNQSFGAVMHVPIEARVLGGVTAIDGVAEAVYMKEDDKHVLFGAIASDAEVLGFQGRTSAWVAYENNASGEPCPDEAGCWSLGLGEADLSLAHRAKVDAVQSLVRELQDQTPNVADELIAAVQAQMDLSNREEIDDALALVTARREESALIDAAMAAGLEQAPVNPPVSRMLGKAVPGHPDADRLLCAIDCVPGPGQEPVAGAIRSYVYGTIPDTTELRDDHEEMQDRLSSVAQQASALEGTLGILAPIGLRYLEEPEIRATSVPNLFVEQDLSWNRRVRSASIDVLPAAVAEAQAVARLARATLDTTEAELQLVRTGVRNTLSDLNDNITRVQTLTDGISQFMDVYATGTESIDRYYASSVSLRWILASWVENQRALLTLWQPEVEATMQAYAAEWQDAAGQWLWEGESGRQSMQDSWESTRRRWDELVTLAAARDALSAVLENGRYEGATAAERGFQMAFESAGWRERVSRERNTVLQGLGIASPLSYSAAEGLAQIGRTMPELLDRVTQSGMRLWHDVPLANLERLALRLPGPAGLVEVYRSARLAQGIRHTAMTRGLDSLYAHQTRLFELLYSMASDGRRLEARYGGRYDAPDLLRYEMLAEEMLARPSIRGISVGQNLDAISKQDDRKTFQNHFSVSWGGATPAAQLVENSVAVAFADPMRLALPFASVGPRNRAGFYAFKVYRDDPSRAVVAEVRARSAGGRTAIRRSNPFEVDVDFHSGNLVPAAKSPTEAAAADVGVASEGETVTRVRDRTPLPSALTLRFPELEQPDTATRRWSTARDRVRVQIAVSSTDQPGDLVLHGAIAPFTETGYLNATAASQVATPLVADSVWGEGTISYRADMTGVSLEQGRNGVCVFIGYPGQPVTLYGPGRTPLFACLAFRVDTTPPALTELSVTQTVDPGAVDARLAGTTAPVVGGAVPAALRPYDAAETVPEAPAVRVSWKATDAESGVEAASAEFCMSPSNDADAVWAEFADSTQVEKRCGMQMGPGLEAGGSVTLGGTIPGSFGVEYLHVRTRNRAGLEARQVSDALASATDVTPPLPPVVQAGTGPAGELVLWLLKEAWDPHTGVAGYQLAVGSAPGLDDLKPWPAGETVEFAADDLVRGGGDRPAYVIPSLEPGWQSPLQQVYFTLRALNAQSGLSLMASTGPVALLDDTPPEDAHLAASVDAESGELVVSADIWDPESGVVRAAFRVLDGVAPSGSDPELRTWGEFVALTEPQKTFRSEEVRIAPAETEQPFESRYLIVELELRNAAGLARSFRVDLEPSVSGLQVASR